MHTEVGDRAAIAFAAAFYRALASGRSVRAAFDQGKLAIELENLRGVKTPRLLVREGVDPDRVFVLEERATGMDGSAWQRQVPETPALDGARAWHAVLCHRSRHRGWALHLYDALRQQGIGGAGLVPRAGAGAGGSGARGQALRARRSCLVTGWQSDGASARPGLDERAGAARTSASSP
jgi:hypothetical protein